ncbi:MAG: sulfotransferase, partial [Sandarakinorhabdus sp.]|nr:sulfotransferase [Sandarakinorhabdus sp.]
MTDLQAAAREALSRGDLAAVRRLAQGLGGTPATAAEGRFLMGIADATEGRISSGIGHVEAAISMAPTAEYLAQHARLLMLLRRDGEARAA